MLYLDPSPVFKARGIEKPYSFLVKAGLSSHSAHIIISSRTRVFRLDHIELLCRVLVCEPNDLLLWVPEKSQSYPANHPLFKLKQDTSANAWPETLATMPFKELKEATKELISKKTN